MGAAQQIEIYGEKGGSSKPEVAGRSQRQPALDPTWQSC